MTSKIDPDKANEDNGVKLPTKQNDEFRPFIRHLPEFKFWYSVTTATLIAFGCTFFEILDIPVFWQILVIYFIVLFCITIRRLKKVSSAKKKIENLQFQFFISKPGTTGGKRSEKMFTTGDFWCDTDTAYRKDRNSINRISD